MQSNNPLRRHTLVLLAFALCACQENAIHLFRDVNIQGWSRTDTVTFHVTDLPRAGLYNLVAEVRVARQFPYQDLTLVVETLAPGAENHDTLTVPTTAPDQNLLGRGRTLRAFAHPLRTLLLHPSDTLHLTVRHLLPQDYVPGVQSLSILLQPADEP